LHHHEHVNNSYRIRKSPLSEYEALLLCPGIGHACKLITHSLAVTKPGRNVRAFLLTFNLNVMPLNHIIINLKRELIRTFAVVDEWFDKELALRNYQPVGGGWCIDEVLEHVMLSNHFLLILIQKGTTKALKNCQECNGESLWPDAYSLDSPALHQIADPQAFVWHRPEHHAPSGGQPLWKIRREIRDQLHQCLIILELMPNGEGTRHEIAMSVNNLGKLDVYHYIYFLALHAQRHLKQMEKIETNLLQLSKVMDN
jgi:hypothetical protein